MAQTILYYPTINIQDGTWLRNAILYWDEVSSIVPYRKRGPKYLDTLQFERALADYTRCEQADGVSVESRYRVGMAQYMLQNYDAATAAFAGSLAIVPQDDDMYIADVYWLVLSQLRAGQADEVQKTFQQHYRPDMYVGHHTAYEKAMRVAAAGFAPMEDMLAELEAELDDLQFAMTASGSALATSTIRRYKNRWMQSARGWQKKLRV